MSLTLDTERTPKLFSKKLRSQGARKPFSMRLRGATTMDQQLRKAIPQHMRNMATGVLAMANYTAHICNYAGFGRWPEFSVIHAAHAVELLVKARIAEEHPMLIFKHPPKKLHAPDLEDLLRSRTIDYKDLPHLYSATTGMPFPNLEEFNELGALRNRIQHFLPPPSVDFGGAALTGIYAVADPILNACWGDYAIDYNEDDPPYDYLVETLIHRRINFLVSSGSAASVLAGLQALEKQGNSEDDKYLSVMQERVSQTLLM